MPQQADHRIPLGHRLTLRLTGGVILALLLIGLPFLFAFHRLLRDQQTQALEEATAGLTRVALSGLRSAMLAGEPHLFDDAVRNLSEQPHVDRVLILDHRGRVQVTSDPSFADREFDRDQEESCRICHRVSGAPPEGRTIITEEAGRRVFRAMSTIPNEPRCHACHGSTTPNNGILLIDFAAGAADGRFLAGIGGTAALGAVMVVVTIVALVILLQKMVHAPLRSVVATSRRISDGDLGARAPVSARGEFALLASQVNQMTEHLSQTLETVETQRRQLQTILDAVDDEIVVLDRDQRVVLANEAFRSHRGLPPEELGGRFCREVSVSHGPCAADHPGGCPVQRVFDSGKLHKGIVSRIDTSGNERAIEIHASPIRETDGAVNQAVEVRRDISERRQLEATLAHSDRLASLGLLASGVSHEINNPLGAIATLVEGLRRRIGSEREELPESLQAIDDALSRIGKEVHRGRSITDRLLKVARSSGRARSLVDVNRLVQDILGILAQEIRKCRIDLRVEPGEELPPLRGDESRLGQVVMNLVLNAIQAMDTETRRLRVATSRADHLVRIEVEDTGSGISPESLRRIYEPFFTTKPAGQGTGLGLFIAHQIVTEMGGAILVRSEPGKGTLFTVELPWGVTGTRP